MDNLFHRLDQIVTGIFSEWDAYTTTILAVIIAIGAYQVVNYQDADAHPMLLARQSQASPVRQPGESAVHRSHSAPHGMPLNAGLNVKDPGDPKWSIGRNGDLRDVWRKVIKGVEDREGKSTGQYGKIATVLGNEGATEHQIADVTKSIIVIGRHIREHKGAKVAIFLPNSIELLASLFACAFYDLAPIMLPYAQTSTEVIPHLKETEADTIIAAVGSLSFDAVLRSCPKLQHVIWVNDEGSKHLDWNEVPQGTGGSITVSTWQDILSDVSVAGDLQLPAPDKNSTTQPVIAIWPNGEPVTFTQANIIAAIAGQLTSVPTVQRMTYADTFICIEPLSRIYPLTLTLAALYSNVSIILTSVAGDAADLELVTRGLSPTVIVSPASSLSALHAASKAKLSSRLYSLMHALQAHSLVNGGVMPRSNIFSRLFDNLKPVIGSKAGPLRLIYTSEQIEPVTKYALSAEMLSDLRIYTGARIVYALTAKDVAGAVTQTGPFDYRVAKAGQEGSPSHFGAPLTCTEVLLRDKGDVKTTDQISAGQIVVRGPAVVGGEAVLGAHARWNLDGTLQLL